MPVYMPLYDIVLSGGSCKYVHRTVGFPVDMAVLPKEAPSANSRRLIGYAAGGCTSPGLALGCAVHEVKRAFMALSGVELGIFTPHT